MEEIIAHYGIIFGYIMLGITALSVLIFSAIQILANLKKAKTAIFSIVAGVGIYLLCFVLARSIPLSTGTGDGVITMSGEQMRFVEANLYLGYTMLAVAILAIAYSSVSNLFK